MSKPKGVDVAFATAALVLQADHDVHFTFAGPIASDEIARDLKRLQDDYPGRVRYMGYVEGLLERTALFRGADVLLFPTMRDVFGLVILHAMAEGVPVVASEEGTIPETLIEGENGFLAKKGDAAGFAEKILSLLRNEALRRKMSAANRQRFEAVYTQDQYGRKMIRAFQDIDAVSDVSGLESASFRKKPAFFFTWDIYFLAVTVVYVIWRWIVFFQR
jgi:glycosyltransferase involved in cell wall biosynthesis